LTLRQFESSDGFDNAILKMWGSGPTPTVTPCVLAKILEWQSVIPNLDGVKLGSRFTLYRPFGSLTSLTALFAVQQCISLAQNGGSSLVYQTIERAPRGCVIGVSSPH
jgi:hypothetical protein